jgi:hypothetical protein
MDVLVAGSSEPLRAAAAQLSGSGYDVRTVESAEEAARCVTLGSLAVVLIPGDPAAATAFSTLTSRLRRRVLVIQLGDDVTTADGTSAFIRGVNLLVSSADTGRLRELLDMAVRRHLELVGLLEPELVR